MSLKVTVTERMLLSIGGERRLLPKLCGQWEQIALGGP